MLLHYTNASDSEPRERANRELANGGASEYNVIGTYLHYNEQYANNMRTSERADVRQRVSE